MYKKSEQKVNGTVVSLNFDIIYVYSPHILYLWK